MSVSPLRARLTKEDVARLADEGNPEARAVAARKFCSRIAYLGLAPEERRAGESILRILSEDAADLVRKSLAVTLSKSPHLPADVAKRLAADADSIAVPIISGSPVLTDEELIEIVRGGSVLRQKAVAGRERVSPKVVREIVIHGDSDAVGVAAANDGAAFDDNAYALTFGRFADEPEVLERFVERDTLAPEITEKLIAHISEEAVKRMVARHALPPQLAVELADAAREHATVDLVEQAGLAPEPRRFVQQLQMNGRLTPSLILRALFRGHIRFFEYAVAELAGIEHRKAWMLVHDAGPLGLEAVFNRTGLPRRVFPAVRAALSAFHSLEMGPDGAIDRARFQKRLAERIFTQFQGAPEADLAYCLERIDADLQIIRERKEERAAA